MLPVRSEQRSPVGKGGGRDERIGCGNRVSSLPSLPEKTCGLHMGFPVGTEECQSAQTSAKKVQIAVGSGSLEHLLEDDPRRRDWSATA